MRQPSIPDKNAWSGYEDDLDGKYFHDLVYGKSIEEVQQHFGGGSSIERSDELLFSPRLVFQYYVLAFGQFVMSEKEKGDSDSACPFLKLLISKEKKDKGSVSNIYNLLSETVDFIANNQEYFDADVNIYGDFEELANEIRVLCNA